MPGQMANGGARRLARAVHRTLMETETWRRRSRTAAHAALTHCPAAVRLFARFAFARIERVWHASAPLTMGEWQPNTCLGQSAVGCAGNGCPRRGSPFLCGGSHAARRAVSPVPPTRVHPPDSPRI